MLKYISISILTVLSLTGLFLNFDSNAEYEIQSQQLNSEEKEIIENIEKVDPQKPQRNKFKRKGNKIVDNSLSVKKEFNLSEKTINLKKDNSNIEIGTPIEVKDNNQTVQDDKIIYESKNNSVDLTVENVDGGIRQVIVIHDKNQPNRYTFPMKLQAGQKFVKNDDESVSVIDSEGKNIMYILKPWAKDNNNKELQTYYEVEDKQIIQYINFENAEFPITADPTWCGRSALPQSVALSRFNVIFGGGSVSYLSNSAWHEFVNKSQTDWSWNKQYGSVYRSLYNQFICHLYNPATVFKFDYNLESDRPDIGLEWTYWNQCNNKK